MRIKIVVIACLSVLLFSFHSCKDNNENDPDQPEDSVFYFGADLSYVNQILDHNGIYRDEGVEQSPYKIFRDHGANLVRLRLWHNPTWTKEVYGTDGKQLYNDLTDVEKAITLVKEQGLAVELDFHYSDSWADPGKQGIPKAWVDIKEMNVLKDSVYNYTFKTLKYLDSKGLMPEFVQIGNEINCGMLYTDAPSGFPSCNVCTDNHWQKLAEVINEGINAVRAVTASSSVKTKVILHVADPKNVTWWFDNITSAGGVSDFDIVGFSYYPLWHTTVTLDKLSDNVSTFKSKYQRDVMILETAYPWTLESNDAYNNSFGSESPVTGYPFSKQGQYDLLKKITQELKDGGGSGIIYWEPAWITSDMKDLWGTGSSWENCTFFDFTGNTIPGIDFMNYDYTN